MNPKNPPISRTLYISSSNEEQERRRKKEKREREKRIDNLEGRMELLILNQPIDSKRATTYEFVSSITRPSSEGGKSIPLLQLRNTRLHSETIILRAMVTRSICLKKKNSGGTAVTLATPFSKPPPPAVAFHPIDLGYDEARQV